MKRRKTMTELRRKMREDLQLAGFALKTQKSYVGAVSGLAKYHNCSPDLLAEEDVRRFFLYLINERKSARSTVTIYLCGIKFFYETTFKRTWNIFGLVRPRHVKKLPFLRAVSTRWRPYILCDIPLPPTFLNAWSSMGRCYLFIY
jgi:hypothetical protein